MAAGGWLSPGFLTYVDEQHLETDVVRNAHVDKSDTSDGE